MNDSEDLEFYKYFWKEFIDSMLEEFLHERMAEVAEKWRKEPI